MSSHADLTTWVRDVPDFPEPGITFRDITPLLANAFTATIDALAGARDFSDVDAFVGIESRGFIMAAPLADRFGTSFVPIRKAGKLPADVIAREYSLEYGTATIEMHVDALEPGARVVLVDDVLATGGTLKASAELVESVGAVVVSHLVLVELAALGGRAVLTPHDVDAILTY